MKIWPRISASTVMIILMLALPFFAKAQDGKTYNVAIFLYEGVELLDFSGPGEAFSASPGFKVYTVSVDGNDLVSQRFVHIKPEYSIETAPVPDIVVFPGGHSEPSANDKRVQDWIKTRFASGTFMMSVCTGAGILGNTGLLNGLTITTFHGYVDGLQAALPTSKVLRQTRFVDNGRILTTAGVSAGIDGALHLVSRIRGEDIAKATAFYMEYDKWDPKQGLNMVEHEYVTKLRKEAEGAEKNLTTPATTPGNTALPYEGELKNLAAEFIQKGSYRAAAVVLERTLKVYPSSAGSSAMLATVYRKLGKPAPIDAADIEAMIKGGKATEAVTQLEKDRKAFPGWTTVSENTLNDLAYMVMLGQKNVPDALKVFQWIVKAYPTSGNAFDSLGEAYMTAGNKEEAIRNYKKSLELDPRNSNAVKMLAQLQNN